MRRFAIPLLLLLGSTLPFAAGAAGVTWLCGLADDAVRLVCIAEPPDAAAAEPAATPAAATVATVRGTPFPLDPQRVWTVDLWSPPNDAADVALLARATICYRSPGCTVVMAPWRPAGVR